MSSSCFLAQINIARASAPLDDPRMAGSVSRLADMNAAAEQSRGFVWRLTDEGAESAYLRAYDDPSIVVNMSVWESIEALSDYVYRSEHVSPLRDRARWFNRLEVPHLALWWTPPDHLPTLVEGKERLAILQQQGPTPLAFTFKRRFPALTVEPSQLRSRSMATNYDGRTFRFVSNPTGECPPNATFSYRQLGNVVWAVYEGARIHNGSLCAHVEADAICLRGTSIGTDEIGGRRLSTVSRAIGDRRAAVARTVAVA